MIHILSFRMFNIIKHIFKISIKKFTAKNFYSIIKIIFLLFLDYLSIYKYVFFYTARVCVCQALE